MAALQFTRSWLFCKKEKLLKDPASVLVAQMKRAAGCKGLMAEPAQGGC